MAHHHCILHTFSQEFAAHSDGKDKKKNWNFPKAHTHIHMFQDILRKGATRNFNTKVNEKGHGPIKDWYKYQTNFKNVDDQVITSNFDFLTDFHINLSLYAVDFEVQ